MITTLSRDDTIILTKKGSNQFVIFRFPPKTHASTPHPPVIQHIQIPFPLQQLHVVNQSTFILINSTNGGYFLGQFGAASNFIVAPIRTNPETPPNYMYFGGGSNPTHLLLNSRHAYAQHASSSLLSLSPSTTASSCVLIP